MKQDREAKEWEEVLAFAKDVSNNFSNPYLDPKLGEVLVVMNLQVQENGLSVQALVSDLLEAELLPDSPTLVYLCLMSLPLPTFCILYGSQRVQNKVDAGFPYRPEEVQLGLGLLDIILSSPPLHSISLTYLTIMLPYLVSALLKAELRPDLLDEVVPAKVATILVIVKPTVPLVVNPQEQVNCLSVQALAYGWWWIEELLLSTRQQIVFCLALLLLSQPDPPGISPPLTLATGLKMVALAYMSPFPTLSVSPEEDCAVTKDYFKELTGSGEQQQHLRPEVRQDKVDTSYPHRPGFRIDISSAQHNRQVVVAKDVTEVLVFTKGVSKYLSNPYLVYALFEAILLPVSPTFVYLFLMCLTSNGSSLPSPTFGLVFLTRLQVADRYVHITTQVKLKAGVMIG